MNLFLRTRSFLLCVLFLIVIAATNCRAQQTLGNINGTVTDASGAAVGDATVSATGDATGLTRTVTTRKNGYFEILDLPIGPYTVTITHSGFDTVKLPAISVQEARSATVNQVLKLGQVSESVTINANPMLNATDTTNGYTLDRAQIEATPLATGSFTQLAILAPGVSAELLSGTGTNAGFGNQPIWANGQRDTSNTFQVDGVDVTNLFNGKSSSESTSQRLNFNIGENPGAGGSTQTDTSVYGSNGQGLPTPPPEFIQELRVTTSMYDAQQGSTSGAHVDVNTASGGNAIHGQAWGVRGTDWLNADPFFYKQEGLATPELHRYVAGGTVGGPIIKDNLFFFLGYQHTQDDDQYGGLAQFQVPYGLTDDRSTTGITNALESYYTASGTKYKAISSYNPAAVALLQYKFANGQFLIPSATENSLSILQAGGYNAFNYGTSTFTGDQAYGALDYNATSTDHLSLKYYYQHAPTSSPYGSSNLAGFTQNEDTGAQVAALANSLSIGSKINWEQRLGFSRQKVYSNYNQGVSPGDVGITIPGFNKFPGLEITEFASAASSAKTLYGGPYSSFVDAGYFENRISPSSNAIFSLGAHTISVGANYDYNQLNIRNDREGSSEVEIKTFPSFLSGKLYKGSILLGDSQRYYRSNNVGSYVQDKWQAKPNLSITAGVRYDFNGPLSEKYGNLFNFDPSLYQASDTAVTSSGFIVAGNNKQYATPGVSDSTLQGRQWGIAPRVGLAYSPGWNHGNVVWRAGYGIYYDRGEYFQYLSPPAGQGISGPFGVTQEAPLASYVNVSGNLSAPFGTAALPSGQTNPAYFNSVLPTLSQLHSECTAANVYNATSATAYTCAAVPFVIGDYDIHNKLPYTQNWNLDFQWQPRSDLAITLGYVGNRGRHAVIPLPFNEPGIATPSHPINGETSSYGYEVLASTPTATCPKPSSNPCPLSSEPYNTYSGGNVDLRVPYIGYDPNSTDFKATGVSSYDALQAHMEKRLSHGIQVGASYTFSHTLDEQSDLGLFFTGDNPNDLRSSYASSDYDRTHIITFNYLLALPDFEKNRRLLSRFTNGWSLIGITVLQSGQPFSIYDYSGSVGSTYFGTNVELINPILPLAPGVTPREAFKGYGGTKYKQPSLDATKFQIPLISPGSQGVPGCDASGGPGGGPLCDVYETAFVPGQRNIFRQAFQKRADITLQKMTQVTERVGVRYRFEVFNVTNTPSFDIPTNDITLDPNYGELGGNEAGTQVQASGGSVTTPSGAGTCQGAAQACAYELYTVPGAKSNNLGLVQNTIGSPRIIQMSLHVLF